MNKTSKIIAFGFCVMTLAGNLMAMRERDKIMPENGKSLNEISMEIRSWRKEVERERRRQINVARSNAHQLDNPANPAPKAKSFIRRASWSLFKMLACAGLGAAALLAFQNPVVALAITKVGAVGLYSIMAGGYTTASVFIKGVTKQ